jgi:hypothetical protein
VADRSRINYGQIIAGLSAILLSYLMCFDWFGTKDSGALNLFSVGHSAWEALDYIPAFLLVTIVAALIAPSLGLVNHDSRPSVPVNAVVGVLGIVSVLLILYRIMDPPDFGSFREVMGDVQTEGTVQLPIFLALPAAAGVAFGGFWARWEEVESLQSTG